MKKLLSIILTCTLLINTSTAQKTLSLAAQQEDFKIFKSSIQEMHAGLYWFISQERFTVLYDSVYTTLKENSAVEEFYVKMRYCMAMLHHGHGGMEMIDKEAGINYRMGLLPKSRKHLPFNLKYLDQRLFILNNCSSNAQIPNGSEIISINGEHITKITKQLLSYIFANGNNETYKYAQLGDYFQFQYFYQVLHPKLDIYSIEIIPFNSKKKQLVKVAAELPQTIANAYQKQTGKEISFWGELVQYKMIDPKKKIGYLKLETFSKYRIENDTLKFEPLLEKIFTQIKNEGIKNLIVDVRNNEGGDDTWQTAVSYFKAIEVSKEAGLSYMQSDKFTNLKYVIENDANKQLLQAFKMNPYFLIDKTTDGRFKLKPQYTEHDTKGKPLQVNAYKGKVYMLQNGLTFSAGFAFAGKMRYLYDKDKSFLKVLGEDYGDDLAAGVGSGGWSLDVLLPNSKVKVNIPITGGGTDKPYTMTPIKILDYRVIPTIGDKIKGIDTEVEFVKKMIK
jgi:Peptidase family S41